MCTISGLYTFSSKLPEAPPSAVATSFPITCAQTMVIASDCVGFTFPGMIELPGSFSGIVISPIPQRGPDASQRTSLAIFIRDTASVRIAAERWTSASCAASASNLLGAVTKGSPVRLAISPATRLANSGCALRPVPTAVPPSASSNTWGSAASMRTIARSSCRTQPEISWPSVSGVASIKCVRPIFTIPAKAFSFSRNASRSRATAGISRSRASIAAATCMAVGNTSLDDCEQFTSSLGWIGFLDPSTPPASSIARFAITSFAFMFVCVPLPVCQMTSGK